MLRAPCEEWKSSEGGLTVLEIAERGNCVRLADNIEFRKMVNRLWLGRVNEKSSSPFALFILRQELQIHPESHPSVHLMDFRMAPWMDF